MEYARSLAEVRDPTDAPERAFEVVSVIWAIATVACIAMLALFIVGRWLR